MSVVTAKTLAEHVFQKLRDDLKSNKYSPGERLKFEEMQKTYAVSGAPLREALCRLMGLGLVVQIGQKGFSRRDRVTRGPGPSYSDAEIPQIGPYRSPSITEMRNGRVAWSRHSIA